MICRKVKTVSLKFLTRPPPHLTQNKCLHFSMFACHPCAGAMLIFSVSFRFERMIPKGNPPTPNPEKLCRCHSGMKHACGLRVLDDRMAEGHGCHDLSQFRGGARVVPSGFTFLSLSRLSAARRRLPGSRVLGFDVPPLRGEAATPSII